MYEVGSVKFEYLYFDKLHCLYFKRPHFATKEICYVTVTFIVHSFYCQSQNYSHDRSRI